MQTSPGLLFLLLVTTHLTLAALPQGLPLPRNGNVHSGTKFIHNRLRSLRALAQALINNEALGENEDAAASNNEAAVDEEAMQSGDGDPVLDPNVNDVFESSGDADDDIAKEQEEETDTKDKETPPQETQQETQTDEVTSDKNNITASEGNTTSSSATAHNITIQGSETGQQNVTQEASGQQEGTDSNKPDNMNEGDPETPNEETNSESTSDDTKKTAGNTENDGTGDTENGEANNAPEAHTTEEDPSKTTTDADNEDAEPTKVSQPAEMEDREEPNEEMEGDEEDDTDEEAGKDEDAADEEVDEQDEERLADEKPASSTPEHILSFIDTLSRPTRLPPIVHPMLHNPSVLQGAVLPRKNHNRRAAGSPFRSPALLRYGAPGQFVGSFFNNPEGREAPLDDPVASPSSSRYQDHVTKLRESIGSFTGSNRQSQSPTRNGPLDLPLTQGAQGQLPRFGQGHHQIAPRNGAQESKNTRFLDLMDSLKAKITIQKTQDNQRRQGDSPAGFSGGFTGLRDALRNNLAGNRGNSQTPLPATQINGFNGLPQGNPNGQSQFRPSGGLTGLSNGLSGLGQQSGSNQGTSGRSAGQSARIQNVFEQLRNLANP